MFQEGNSISIFSVFYHIYSREKDNSCRWKRKDCVTPCCSYSAIKSKLVPS